MRTKVLDTCLPSTVRTEYQEEGVKRKRKDERKDEDEETAAAATTTTAGTGGDELGSPPPQHKPAGLLLHLWGAGAFPS
ncbi:UNVERIFIED_CONTAM: hypothetical protein FKN15_048325 [Acipenser sinensis]